MNHRHLATILATVTILAACSSSAKNATPPTVAAPTTAVQATTATTSTPTTAPPITTSAATDPTTIAPTTTTTELTSPSTTEPDTTSPTDPQTTVTPSSTPAPDDWVAIIQRLGQLRQDLYAAPDVSRILEVCGDKSECFDQLSVQIDDLSKKGWHVAGADPFVVLSARLEKFDGATLDTSLLVTIIAVVQRSANAGTIVDSAGTKIAAVEAGTTKGFNAQGRFILARIGTSESPWRIVSQDPLPEVKA